MILASTDGATVSLQPLRYQFPKFVPDGVHDYDANWLVVAGKVAMADGRSWHFEDPCLTTWEARSLAEWLLAVVSGELAPTPCSGNGDEVLTVFTEPNLAFSLADRSAGAAALRVHFSLESGPPWLADDADLYDFFVPLALPLRTLEEAVATWADELAQFPER